MSQSSQPPDHLFGCKLSAHSWRDFFIHIATILVGLLIAVGLEQTVEALHHRHQAAELREALHTESEQIPRDSEITANGTNIELSWVKHRIKQVQATVCAHQRLSEPPVLKTGDFDFPDDPIWRSAKAAGLTELLHQEERNAYSEVELVMAHVQATYDEWRLLQRRRIEFEREFPLLPGGTTDLSPASPQDMRTYLGLLQQNLKFASSFTNGTVQPWASKAPYRRDIFVYPKSLTLKGCSSRRTLPDASTPNPTSNIAKGRSDGP